MTTEDITIMSIIIPRASPTDAALDRPVDLPTGPGDEVIIGVVRSTDITVKPALEKVPLSIPAYIYIYIKENNK